MRALEKRHCVIPSRMISLLIDLVSSTSIKAQNCQKFKCELEMRLMTIIVGNLGME